jgi:hypothetical protein
MEPNFQVIERPKDLRKFGEKIGVYIEEKASEDLDKEENALRPEIFRNLLGLLLREGLIVFGSAEREILGEEADLFSKRVFIPLWNDLHGIVSDCE